MSLSQLAPEGGVESFQSTRWTLVLAAGDDDAATQQSLSALSELCRIYWRPLYLFLRRQGHAPADAQDLTQGFFADLIQNRSYARATQEKGRFRSFLLGALKHFVADERARACRQKRGGGMHFVTFDEETLREIESQPIGAAQKSNSDALYEHEWAEALLRQALERLGQESALQGKSALFKALLSYLPSGQEEVIPYEQLAGQLNRGILTLRSDVSRLRARFRLLLREEVRGTLTDPAEVADELRHLCHVLAQA